MSHTPHELSEEFPDHAQKIHALRMSDRHFTRMTDAYHEVNRAVHRAERPCCAKLALDSHWGSSDIAGQQVQA